MWSVWCWSKRKAKRNDIIKALAAQMEQAERNQVNSTDYTNSILPEYLNHWRIIGNVLSDPKHIPTLGTDPESYQCLIADAGNDDNRILLRWDNPAEWEAVVAEIHEGNRIYVEGELEMSVFYSTKAQRHRSKLFNVVRRWQIEPPEDRDLNDWVVVARLRYDPDQQQSTDRNIVRLVFEWPEQNLDLQTRTPRKPIMHFAQAYVYNQFADEAMLSMAAGDRIFLVGIAYRDVWEEEDRHRVMMHAYHSGLGVENEERVWQAYLRTQEDAGIIA